jgi:uncharacterized protein involved in tolerance to divalent cations
MDPRTLATLVETRLAASVNILAGARSVYRWKDKIEDSPEWMLVIKTRRDLFPRLREALSLGHSYEVPEVLALAVVDGCGRLPGGPHNFSLAAWGASCYFGRPLITCSTFPLDTTFDPTRNSV